MSKKIVFLALLLAPAFAFAQQSLKIGYINYQEIDQAMPEYTQMVDSLQKQAAEYEEIINEYNKEIETKYTAFMEQRESLTESLRLRRQQDIEELMQKLQNVQQTAQERQQLLYNQMSQERQQKVAKIVQEIGAENNFSYVVDAQVMWYVSPNSTDVTPLVKQKLGLQ